MSQSKQSQRWDLVKLYNTLRHCCVVLYGEPGVGKTFLVARLCHVAYKLTGKPSLYFALDENLDTQYGLQIKAVANAEWKTYENPWDIYPELMGLTISDAKKYSVIVLDSLTGFQEDVMEIFQSPTDPRINLVLIRTASMITKRFARLSHRSGTPTIIISHSASIYGDQPAGVFEKQRPAFATRALKNVDLVLHLVKEKRGKVLRCEFYREILGKPPFGFIYVRQLHDFYEEFVKDPNKVLARIRSK